jgi:8-hydroxy-5-deazaflavin:NADPH oxidoreductase
MAKTYTIAIVGGTGEEGRGLALRWAKAGHRVIVGSRDVTKAVDAALQMKEMLADADIRGADHKSAAAAADIIVLTVPYSAQRATVEHIADALEGKILVDTTVPLVPPKVARVQLPDDGSAVAAIQRLLGEKVRVVSAFQNVAAHHLKDLAHSVDCDVLICGDDPAAREIAVGLAADIGLRGIHAGPIANSAASEALTSILIAINMRYKVQGSGIRITGLPPK